MQEPREKKVTAQDVVDLMNAAAALDPQAVRALVHARVVCNDALAGHPSIQVGRASDTDPGGPWVVGLLGILNGIFGTFDNGWGCITVILDDSAAIRFEACDNSRQGEAKPE